MQAELGGSDCVILLSVNFVNEKGQQAKRTTCSLARLAISHLTVVKGHAYGARSNQECPATVHFQYLEP
jgi:hypothetical protein